MVYKFETFCGVSIHHLAALVQKELQNSKNFFFLEHTTVYYQKKESILPEFNKDEKLKKEAIWKLSFLKLRSDIASPVVW